PTRHTKLKKADILKMTVKHIQTMQRQHLSTAVVNNLTMLPKFCSEFSESATEVLRYINYLDPAIKQQLVSHLNNCMSHLQQMAPFYNHYVSYIPERLYPEVKVGFQSDFQNGDKTNNGSARIQIPHDLHGVHLNPSRLPTDEWPLLVSQSAGIFANFPPTTDTSTRIGQSAFTAIQRPHSRLLNPSTSTSSYGDGSYHLEHPHASSPNHHQPQHRFKLLEQSPASSKSFLSSSETQKSHISSSSKRKSPTTTFLEPKLKDNVATKKNSAESTESTSHSSGFAVHSLRLPFSVITDKTYYRAPNSSLLVQDSLRKRSHSNEILAISDKRPRYQGPTSSYFSTNNVDALKSTNEHLITAEDLPASQNYQTSRNTNTNSNKFSIRPAGPSGSNNDMWRPW
ncbi:protein hairy-like, partial [Pseudomyrmex gracilis]|uniref:protein hairy-like n=1 Tax=Pseudomyrmex gracilis TaxID=219809 RepID=UPI000994DE4B